jgi:hypothetical protein
VLNREYDAIDGVRSDLRRMPDDASLEPCGCNEIVLEQAHSAISHEIEILERALSVGKPENLLDVLIVTATSAYRLDFCAGWPFVIRQGRESGSH